MIEQALLRRLAIRLLTGFALTGIALSAPIVVGSFSQAQAQVSVEFHEALTPYGSWRRHGRWGEVWVPSRRASDWRPYQAGHWVYTDEWGWFWDTDDSEADFGWITYHYGRWMHDETGWFWIPGEEWAPAWVDWRYSDDYVGWAPLPPDDVEVEYESQPTVWVFVAPRYLTEPRWRTYVAPPQERVTIFRSSRIVNRTVVFQERGRAAVNPGISPAFIASVTHRPVQSYRVSPHVLASTRGVAGAVTVRPQDLRGNGPRGARGRTTITRVSVQKTNVVIKPEAKAPPAPQALGKDEKGRLGNRPPRAAQGAVPANGQPPAGERREQRPGQAAPNGQQRPNVTPPATTPAKPAPGAPANAARPTPSGQTKPPAPAATPAKPEPAKPAPATAPREERRGSPPAAAPAQREKRPEERAAPPREDRRAPAAAAPARPAEPRAPRPAAPSRPVAPPPAAHPQPPAPPHPAAPPPAARPAPPPAQHVAPPPQAPKPPPAARPAPPRPAAPAPRKPEEEKK